jgi:hypothetical protein
MMSKKKAHIILIFIDIFSISCLWAGYKLISHVVIDIAHSADAIEFNSRVGFFCFGALMPLVHLFAIYEYFFPKTVEKRTALISWSALILLIVLFACGFFISARLRTHVEQAGYLRCPQADRQLSFSTGLVYTRDDATCSRRVEEKRKPRI